MREGGMKGVMTGLFHTLTVIGFQRQPFQSLAGKSNESLCPGKEEDTTLEYRDFGLYMVYVIVSVTEECPVVSQRK